jgi:archaellum biogenesis ATPase FlaH
MTMNEFEREDFSFIMNLTEQEWQDFMKQSSVEDLAYALLLTAKAQNEQEVLLMDCLDQDTENLDCTEALEIINRVKKGASK